MAASRLDAHLPEVRISAKLRARLAVKPYTLVTAGQATSDVRRRVLNSGIRMPRDP